jgi:hypothetical protein
MFLVRLSLDRSDRVLSPRCAIVEAALVDASVLTTILYDIEMNLKAALSWAGVP